MIATIIHSQIGLLHVFAACLALLSGTLVLALRKGTRLHKQMGYLYFAMMLATNLSAFGLYHLFGKFGPFHFAALLSLFTVTMGMIPAFSRKPKHEWLQRHIAWIYFSVIGLYAAFASEVIVRIPGLPFFALVGMATAVVMICGSIFYHKKFKNWKAA